MVNGIVARNTSRKPGQKPSRTSGFVKLIAKSNAKLEKNAKLGGVSSKRLPFSAENNGNYAQTWNPSIIHFTKRTGRLFILFLGASH
jgi:hypothetical protein